MYSGTQQHNIHTVIHCSALRGKKVAERKYAALGIALSRPPGSELSLRFPFDKRIPFCSSTLFLEYIIPFYLLSKLTREVGVTFATNDIVLRSIPPLSALC